MTEPRKFCCPEDRVAPAGIAKLSDLVCGCGSPDDFWRVVLEVLEKHESRESRPWGWCHQEMYRYFAVNVIDGCGLLEHGTSIAGSWLTDDGLEALAFLREHGLCWDDQPHWIGVDDDGEWRHISAAP